MLLSHFGDWHRALGGTPHVLELPGESDDDYGARLDRIWDELNERKRAAGVLGRGFREWPEGVRRDLEQSWEQFLDPSTYGRWDTVQATAHLLRAQDVIEAVRIGWMTAKSNLSGLRGQGAAGGPANHGRWALAAPSAGVGRRSVPGQRGAD